MLGLRGYANSRRVVPTCSVVEAGKAIEELAQNVRVLLVIELLGEDNARAVPSEDTSMIVHDHNGEVMGARLVVKDELGVGHDLTQNLSSSIRPEGIVSVFVCGLAGIVDGILRGLVFELERELHSPPVCPSILRPIDTGRMSFGIQSGVHLLFGAVLGVGQVWSTYEDDVFGYETTRVDDVSLRQAVGKITTW